MSLNSASIQSRSAAHRECSLGVGARILRSRIFNMLSRMEEGYLVISELDGEYRFGNPDSPTDLKTRLQISDPRFYSAVVLRGSVGAGESYMDNQWECDNLTSLVRLFSRNRSLLDSLESGWTRLFMTFLRSYHRKRRNTRQGSRRNISDHYDLSNEFFSLFLDDSLMYSCAFFESDQLTLHEASLAKLDKVCRQLGLSQSEHVVEIGSGWGGFALYAAKMYGCRVTTTTISKEQFDLTRKRVFEEGLSEQIEVLLQDYRDLRGSYDKLVSIEMIEAVGDEFLDLYFKKCAQLLKPAGRMLIQAITIAPEFFEESRRNVDFIKRYIFPGSSLPSELSIKDSASRTGELTLTSVYDLTEHYARTLREWRQRFWENISLVRRLGFSKRFIRMWDFYFCYCEAGFLERHIGDYQFVFERKGVSDG